MEADPSQEEMEAYRAVFQFFDRDGDGRITIHELGDVLQSLERNLPLDELDHMIREVDANGNGTIEFNEFLNLMTRDLQPLEFDVEEVLAEAFRKFDIDGNGYISAGELMRVMISLGVELTDDEVKQMIRDADIDGDGRISYDEFHMIIMAV